jgi:hypothetical protein
MRTKQLQDALGMLRLYRDLASQLCDTRQSAVAAGAPPEAHELILDAANALHERRLALALVVAQQLLSEPDGRDDDRSPGDA